MTGALPRIGPPPREPDVVVGSRAELEALIGQRLGPSRWVEIAQEHVDGFAALCGDHQWVHVDTDRAAFGPYGTTIAHGFMALSLVTTLVTDLVGYANTRLRLNYGLDRVRFLAPMAVPARLRLHSELVSVTDIEAGARLEWSHEIEMDGSERPACVATALNVVVFD